MRQSPCIAWRGPKRSASGTMERNFKLRKGRPPTPTRSWLNSTGPPSPSLMAMATRAQSGGDVGPARGEDPVELARDDAAGQPLAESDHEDVCAAEGIGQALFRLAREKSHPLEAQLAHAGGEGRLPGAAAHEHPLDAGLAPEPRR